MGYPGEEPVKYANVSIDLDGLACYHRIHGITDEGDPAAIYRVAVPRYLELFRDLGISATFFVIAADLEHDDARRALDDALDAGHEVASHTYHHPYDLRRWSARRIADEIDTATDAIADAVGIRPVGFRTPGYNVDTVILRLLAERGYRYDSSVFPCPPYYLAKGAIMGAMALFGRPSGSAMTHPAALTAPLQPYRPSRWDFASRGDRKHSLPLWEIPIGVVPGARVPVIGTSVGALSPRAAVALSRVFRLGQTTLQFEMHAIDLMDRQDDVVSDALGARQPDLRRSWTTKRATFTAFFEAVADEYEFTTLAELADAFESMAGPIVVSSRDEDRIHA